MKTKSSGNTKKKCTGPCGQRLSLAEFPRHYRARDGRMSLCHRCYVAKIQEKGARALTAHFDESKAKSVPEPIKLRCTCQPRKIRVIERMRQKTYELHAATCMIFRHNQPDNIPRSSSLDDAALKYGGLER